MYWISKFCVVLGLVVPCSSMLSEPATARFPTVVLELEKSWRLDSKVGRFDASGIERGPDGELLVVRDSELAVYAVRFEKDSDVAALVKHARYSVDKRKLDVGVRRFDVEGLAIDAKGVLHACDEHARRILRFSSRGRIESIPIDLSSVESFFSKQDRNASFEGIAIGGGRLFLANERSRGRLIEFDLASMTVRGSFTFRTGATVWPDTHFSGLDWYDGKLFALLREEQAIAEIDPESKEITKLLRYHEIEFDKEFRYRALVPFFGVMEGLLVEGDVFWLLADNNGQALYADPSDSRASLFKCRLRTQD